MTNKALSTAGLTQLGLFRYSMMHLLVALAVLFVMLPFIEYFPSAVLIESVMISVVLLSAVFVVGGRHRSLVFGLTLVTIAIGGRVFHHLMDDRLGRTVTLSAGTVLVVFVIARLLMHVLRARYVNSHVLSAAVSIYLLLAMVFSFAYALVALWIPKAFIATVSSNPDYVLRGFDALYFSFVTLNTVGYGDIVPVAPVARMLAMLEATCGLLFVSILISRLVSMYSADAPE